MAFGILKADTLTHSTAGSVATNFVVHGSNKMWIAFSGNTATAYDSLNVTSELDNGPGDHTFSFTNNFNAAKAYTSAQSVQLQSSSYPGSYIAGESVVLTSSIRVYPTRNTSGQMSDTGYSTLNCSGDLA